MSKTKARIVTGIVALFLFCTIYVSSGYAIRWYNTFRSIFAVFGEIMALWTLYRWLIEPDVDPRHIDVPMADDDTILEGWTSPFIKVKETKKNGQNMAATDGLSNAGDPAVRSEPVHSGPVAPVRAGNGENKIVSAITNSAPPWEPESGPKDQEDVLFGGTT